MLTCLGFTIALIVIVFMFFAYGNNNVFLIFPFSMLNHNYSLPFMLGSFFLLAMPLIGLMLLASRLIFNRTTVSRSTGFTLLIIWIVSLCMVIYYSVKVAAEFKSGGKISQTISIKPTANNTYYLKLNNVRYLSSEDSSRLDIKHGFAGKMIMDDDNDFNDDLDENSTPRGVTIYIERSDIPQPVLIESFSARGKDYTDALMNARNTTYQLIQQDSTLTFDRHVQYPHHNPYRKQEVKLTLKVPLNAKLIIEQNLDRYLDGIDVYGCKRDNKNEKAQTATFTMTDNGLQCKVDTLITKPDSILKK